MRALAAKLRRLREVVGLTLLRERRDQEEATAAAKATTIGGIDTDKLFELSKEQYQDM